MASLLTAAQQDTQRLIDECEAAGGECIPCLELLKRIDADLAILDREAAQIRWRRWMLTAVATAVAAVLVVGLVWFRS